MLEQEIKYYNEHLTEWLKKNLGLFVVIKNKDVLGFYNTFDSALTEAVKRYGLVPYLIRRVTLNQEEIVIPALTLGLINANIS